MKDVVDARDHALPLPKLPVLPRYRSRTTTSVARAAPERVWSLLHRSTVRFAVHRRKMSSCRGTLAWPRERRKDLMTDWVARYEECYTTADAGPGIHRVGNGLLQTEDVGERPEFAALRVASIWRRVTFERVAFRADANPMSEADGTYDSSGHTTDGGVN